VKKNPVTRPFIIIISILSLGFLVTNCRYHVKVNPEINYWGDGFKKNKQILIVMDKEKQNLIRSAGSVGLMANFKFYLGQSLLKMLINTLTPYFTKVEIAEKIPSESLGPEYLILIPEFNFFHLNTNIKPQVGIEVKIFDGVKNLLFQKKYVNKSFLSPQEESKIFFFAGR